MRLLRSVFATMALLSALLSPCAFAQAVVATGFELPEYVPGDVDGQNGWGHPVNSPTTGVIGPVPVGSPVMFGAQSLAITTLDATNLGVFNHLYSPTIVPAAGETGAVAEGVPVPNPQPVFQASLWYHTPVAPLTTPAALNGLFAQLNPSTNGGADLSNRYTAVSLINTTNTNAGQVRVQITGNAAAVATLDWNNWYRFEYLLHLIDGDNGGVRNDRFTLTVFDLAGNQIGTACGSTLEMGYKTGSFGGGPGPRAVNGFDFFSMIGPNGTVVGYIDNLTMTTAVAPAPVVASVSGETNVCSGGTTALTASASGGMGTFSYVWRDASTAIVGTTQTLVAGPGSYTVTTTDALCVSDSATHVVTAFDPLAATIDGNTSVCFGGTTTLTATVTGGSGSITAYEWRDTATDTVVGTASTLTAGAGTYTVTVTDASCGTATSAPVQVQVTCKATPVVTWSDPADIVYGTPLSGTQLNATANVPGTFVYSPPAGTILDAGPDQVLTVDFFPTDSANYENVEDTTVEINVLPATPDVTVSGGPFVYDATPHGASAIAQDASSNPVSGTFAFTYDGTSTVPVNAGTYDVVATFTSSDPNFTNAVGNGTITIAKAPTTIVISEVFPSPSTIGEPVTVHFSIGGIFGTPSGSVEVTDGVDSCVAPATATNCTMTMTTEGRRTITATYSGDGNHIGSTSDAVSHRVDSDVATARVDGSTFVCEGGSATIRVRLTGVAPWTIVWSDGLVESTSNATHFRTVTPETTTTYAVVDVRDQNGRGDASGGAEITVRTVSAPEIIEAPLAEIGKAVTLRATPGYTSYQWFLDGRPIAGATGAELTIDPVTQDDLGTYTVLGRQNACPSAPSTPHELVLLALPVDDAVIPVVGTVHGINGSLFRTTLHLTNGTGELSTGEITFIDQNVPAYPYSLGPGETRFIDDLLPPSFAGLTSANVRPLTGSLPIVIAHVFDDQGNDVTTGMIERAIPLPDTLSVGDRAVLVTPLDPETTRFNLGMRSLSAGLTVRVVRRNAAGQLVETFDRELPPATLTHELFLAGSSDSLTFEVVAGGGVIYGAATDNGTNDPNLQIATRVTPATPSGRYVLPVAGSGPGNFDSFFATGLQIHNPGDEPLEATLRFIPANVVKTVIVAPRETLAMADVVASLGTSGFGSLEVTTVSPIAPVILATIYSVADEGQTSLMTDLVPFEEVLDESDEAVIVAPHTPEASRFNIGLRTLAEGAQIAATIRDGDGKTLAVIALAFGPDIFVQDGARTLLGHEFTGDESVTFEVIDGSAVIYGVWTDNVTQDPALQIAARP